MDRIAPTGISDHDLLFSKNEDATGGDHWRNEGRAQSVHHFKSGNTGSGCTTNTFGLAKGKAAARRTALTSSGAGPKIATMSL